MHEALYQPFPISGRARGQIWRYAPEFRRPRHFHSEPELNLVCAGRGAFGTGANVIPVGAGDLLWWPPGQDHVLLDASPDFDLFVVGVTPELYARVLGVSGRSSYGCATGVRIASHELKRFREVCAAPLDGDAAVIERRVGDFWRDARALGEPAAAMHTLTRRALRSLQEQPDLQRSDVARVARAHPSEVSRHFHEDMGLTLTAFRTRVRVLRFIQLVDGAGGSWLSAALGAGFGSYSQCHRAFQSTLGCTPRAFFRTSFRQTMRDTYWPLGESSQQATRHGAV